MSKITNNIISWCIAGAMLMPGFLTPEIEAQSRISKESKYSKGSNTAKSLNTPKTAKRGNNAQGNNRRPGNNGNQNRPNHNNNNRPGFRPGSNSHIRPGAGSKHHPRPKYRPSYGRPHTHFGHWRPLPPPPPRPAVVYTSTYVAPTISSVLGLAFGTLIEYGINSLINGGYNVSGYQNDAIFLSNISLMGYRWPQATVYYSTNGMNGALFQYRCSSWSASPYDKVFRELCQSYGQPVEIHNNGANRSATWWGGNDGYITLTAEGGYDNVGMPYCDTNLIYGR